MITKITGGPVVLETGLAVGLQVYLQDGHIAEITAADLSADEVVQAAGRYVSPGFIDIHSHGGGGADFLDGTAEAFLCAARLHAQHGTTTLVPTATSGDAAGMANMNQAYVQACQRNELGADMPGLHLEGPYFAMAQRGAQDPRYLRDPKPEEYLPMLQACPHLLRWSIAPELPGALAMGRTLHQRGIMAAIGHSDAEYSEVEAAVGAGFTHVTHLYSGMSMVHRRNMYRYGGVVEAAYLLDELTVEIIADGKHLPAELLKLIYKCKGPHNIALITDSMRGAGMPDGPTMLGHWQNGLPCYIEDGVAKLPDGSGFAGSVATADRLVRNMVQLAQVPLYQAVNMASRTPARIMRFADRGALRQGLRADVVLFDEDICVSDVWVGGKRLPKT